MPNSYPNVMSEKKTLQAVVAGQSIARYGDGEFKLITGGDCVSQVWTGPLALELRAILADRSTKCITAIPNMTGRSPKRLNWQKYKFQYAQYCDPRKKYGSSFITRPDSAPWIACPSFFDSMESLWKGLRIGLVSCLERSLTPALMPSAKSIEVVQIPRRDAYAHINEIVDKCMSLRGAGIDRFILCAGPTATCLAHRLDAMGAHAIDLGHVGMFWRQYHWREEWEKTDLAK